MHRWLWGISYAVVLVRDGEIQKPAGLARPKARIVEFSGQEIFQKAGEVFDRLSAQAEVLLIRQLPEVLHVRELFLNFVRKRYNDETALKVSKTLFERKERPTNHSGGFCGGVRHLRDTGAMSALFSRLLHSFDLPPPINIDCGFFRLVATDDLLLPWMRATISSIGMIGIIRPHTIL